MQKSLSLGGVNAFLRQIELEMGLLVDEVEIESGAARVGLSPFSFELSEAAPVSVRISASSVEKFLNLKAPSGVKDFAVELKDGKIRIQATVKLVFEIRAGVVCRIEIEGEQKLLVVLESVDSVASMARGMIESQIEKVNPLLDASELPISVHMKTVEIEDGWIQLTGQISGTK